MAEYQKPFFPVDTPEEIIFALAGGDIEKMERLNKTRSSTVQIFMIIKSKQSFIDWYNTPEMPEEPGDGFGN